MSGAIIRKMFVFKIHLLPLSLLVVAARECPTVLSLSLSLSLQFLVPLSGAGSRSAVEIFSPGLILRVVRRVM